MHSCTYPIGCSSQSLPSFCKLKLLSSCRCICRSSAAISPRSWVISIWVSSWQAPGWSVAKTTSRCEKWWRRLYILMIVSSIFVVKYCRIQVSNFSTWFNLGLLYLWNEWRGNLAESKCRSSRARQPNCSCNTLRRKEESSPYASWGPHMAPEWHTCCALLYLALCLWTFLFAVCQTPVPFGVCVADRKNSFNAIFGTFWRPLELSWELRAMYHQRTSVGLFLMGAFSNLMFLCTNVKYRNVQYALLGKSCFFCTWPNHVFGKVCN